MKIILLYKGKCSTSCISKAVVIFQSSGCAFDPLLVHFEVLRAIENKFIYGNCNNLFPSSFFKRFVPINIIIVVCFSTFFNSFDTSRRRNGSRSKMIFRLWYKREKTYSSSCLNTVIYGLQHKNVNDGWYFDSVKKDALGQTVLPNDIWYTYVLYYRIIVEQTKYKHNFYKTKKTNSKH